jgi:hypothetical protein
MFVISPVAISAMQQFQQPSSSNNNMTQPSSSGMFGNQGQNPMMQGQHWLPLVMSSLSLPGAIIVGGVILIEIGYRWGYQSCKAAHLEMKINSLEDKIALLENKKFGSGTVVEPEKNGNNN